MSRPILPARLAVDSIKEVRGFVAALLQSRKTDTSEAIQKCLFEEDPMIKGPFISLSLPFLSTSAEDWPLDSRLKEDFDPYAHQMKAFRRLSGDHPQHTLVTTGTGSGKSECFIMPIMDYVLRCKAEGKKKGVKALIMYPMNALIEDQGERLSQIANKLNASLPSDQHIRVGRYTGSAGKTISHDPHKPKAIIDDRDALCQDPPDILLTNYKMLDFMLFRPEEQKFWSEESSEVFRYLVLDELHTFDGAQGADVACLIRRLRLKINQPFTCVGTSATVAGGNSDDDHAMLKGQQQLAEFATTLFGENIGIDSILTEERLNAQDYMEIDQSLTIPSQPVKDPIDLLLSGHQAYESHLKAICEHWQAPLDAVDRGKWIRSHPLTEKLLGLDLAGEALDGVSESLEMDEALLVEFLDLLASARIMKGSRESAVFNFNAQIWVSETSYLLRKIDLEPHFKRFKTNTTGYLPAVNCRSCGLSGWFTTLTESHTEGNGYHLGEDTSKLFASFFSKDGAVLFLRTDASEKSGPADYYFSPYHDRIVKEAPKSGEAIPLRLAFLSAQSQGDVIPRVKKKKGEDHTKCPECDESLALSFSTVSRSMLSSVLAGTFLAHGANPDDRKLLVFNDSVQDTAHQAGYLSARAFRFNVRRFLFQMCKRAFDANNGESLSLKDLQKHVAGYCSDLWKRAAKERGEGQVGSVATKELMQVVPKDLWEYWKGRADRTNPLNQEKNLVELIERLSWEFYLELGLNSNLGWSVKKSGLVTLRPKNETLDAFLKILDSSVIKSELDKMHNPESFVSGIIDRLIARGVVYHLDLKPCYGQKNFSHWPLIRNKPHLSALFSHQSAVPNILSIREDRPANKRLPIQYAVGKSHSSWYALWTLRHIDATDDKGIKGKISRFLEIFFKDLAVHEAGLVPIKDDAEDEFVLDAKALELVREEQDLYQCQTCAHTGPRYRSRDGEDIQCDQYRCTGTMLALGETEKEKMKDFSGFLARQYQRDIEAPFAHTHTGGLKANDRRMVEEAFKVGLIPGDPLSSEDKVGRYYNDHPINVLTCTPTLEMGIDIGSLSGVTLRGYPATLASSLQRLGRSGRKSGNAFNTILSGKGAHDRYQWDHPSLFFKGSVEPPGCEFRTKDFIRRQFHAFLLDSYVAGKDDLVFPSERNLGPKDSFVDHPFWLGFEEYLRESSQEDLANQFLSAIALGDTPDNDFSISDNLVALMKAFHKEEGLWAMIYDVLIIQDRSRTKASESLKGLQQAESGLDLKNDKNEDAQDLSLEAKAAEMRKSRVSTGEYTLSVLSARGVLPNYAFPEQGIYFTCTANVIADKDASDWKKKYRTLKYEISRPANPGLRELAPGNTYYIDSVKAPITRIVRDEKLMKKQLLCEACGHISNFDEPRSCPVCGSEQTQSVKVLTPREISSSGKFTDLQIKDQEEDRERAPLRIEPFINYYSEESQAKLDRATWVSENQGISFEFRMNAEINFVVRPKTKDAKDFKLCQECWAVPYRGKADDAPKFSRNGFDNRHDPKCKHYQDPDNSAIKLDHVILAKSIKSDTIRFSTLGGDSLPTIQSVLRLAMKIRLKGQPQHLGMTASFLDTDSNGKQVVATLYDTVPGGTGHLRALMPKIDEDISKSTSGHKQLNKLFDQTLRFLKNCPCSDGCYNCLLSYQNQYHHEVVNKDMAIHWLENFIMADDWTFEKSSIDKVLATESLFDSRLEQMFFDGLTKRDPAIMGIKKTVIDFSGPQRTARFIPYDGDDGVLEHTSSDRVSIKGSITYTKPDFTLYKGNQLVAHIYTDGAEVHLKPKKEKSTFAVTDVPARTALLQRFRSNDEYSNVLTYSFDMIDTWHKWVDGEREADDYKSLESRIRVGDRNIHCLSLCLIQMYSDGEKFTKSADVSGVFEDWLRDLRICFVSLSLGNAIGTDKCEFFNPRDKKFLDFIAEKVLQDGSGFGGLSFKKEGEQYFWEMSDKQSVRKHGEGINPDYKVAWELFWVLWYINPSLVRMDASELELLSKPQGYQYLRNKKEIAVADEVLKTYPDALILEEKEWMDDLEISPQLIWLEPSVMIAFDQQLELSRREIDEELRKHCQLCLLDINDSIEDLLASVRNFLKKDLSA